MACSDVYPPAGARDHVTEVNADMLAELEGRSCPLCDCRVTHPLNGDDDHDAAALLLRVCSACNEIFGYDDSTFVPDHLLPPAEGTHRSGGGGGGGGGIWDNYDGDEAADGPRPSSPCFADVDWSSGNEGRAGDRDDDRRHHSEFSDPPRRGGGRRGRRGCGGHGRAPRGRHHRGGDRCDHQGHSHRHSSQGHRDEPAGPVDSGSGRGGVQASSNGGGDPWMQIMTTCMQSGMRLMAAAPDLAAGRHDAAISTACGEMEPLGRAVGSAVGSVAASAIGSPQAGDIGATVGSTVGRGVADALKDSSLCNRRTSSQHH